MTLSPAIAADGTIYSAPTNNTVYALTFNGTAAVQKWTFAVDFCSGNFPSAIGADGSMLLDGGATHTRYSTTLCSEGSPLLRQMMRNASKLLPHLGRLSSKLHILDEMLRSEAQPWAVRSILLFGSGCTRILYTEAFADALGANSPEDTPATRPLH